MEEMWNKYHIEDRTMLVRKYDELTKEGWSCHIYGSDMFCRKKYDEKEMNVVNEMMRALGIEDFSPDF
jgi:hypothetical protein